MRADLVILTPSRSRPASVERLINACHKTCQARTALFFAFDRDDPQLDENLKAVRKAPLSTRWVVGPRDTLSGWTNAMARMAVTEARALASLGDDHVPQTTGWDVKLLDVISSSGGTGIAYGNDLLQGQNLPTAPVISAEIVAALGWFCEPSLTHMYVDNVWRVLGQEARCLYYVPEVVIEHVHHAARKAQPDAVNWEAEAKLQADCAAYQRWLDVNREYDVATVRELVR